MNKPMRIEPSLFNTSPAILNSASPASLINTQQRLQIEGLLLGRILLTLTLLLMIAIPVLFVFDISVIEKFPKIYLIVLFGFSVLSYYTVLAIIIHKLNRRVWLWMLVSITNPILALSVSFFSALFLKPVKK